MRFEFLVAILAFLTASGAFAKTKEDSVIDEALKIAKISDEHSRSCARTVDAFPGVVMVGYFAHDRGCASAGFVFKKTYTKDPFAAGQALMAAGWRDLKKREALAVAWMKAIELRALEATAALQPDGSVIVTGRRAGYVGMRGQTPDVPVKVTFKPDGNAVSTNKDDDEATKDE